MASVSDGAYGPNLPGNIPGVGYFLDQDNSGKWVDRSSELFKAISDRRGCGKALTQILPRNLGW